MENALEGFLDTGRIVAGLNFQKGMSVADFGCGSGYFTIIIAKLLGDTGKMYALDIQESPLEAVKMKAQAEGLHNVMMIRANLEVAGSTKLPDDSQDWVLLANILFQSQKKKEIVQEAKRVLKSGGQILLIDWKKGTGGGPPDSLRTDEGTMQQIVSGEGLSLVSSIDAGKFHYGMIFKK
jgi:ubiquinone/menaquinone biosynthesis C-methylase UbiE